MVKELAPNLNPKDGVQMTDSDRYIVGQPGFRRGVKPAGEPMVPGHPVIPYPGEPGDKIRPAGPPTKVGQGF
ncbi:MAG TPA: hypothetical protein VN711_01935 [Candidatus Saccharimonadales bacterium]|nr:hypothetical protein [Candidatus Saccharimonadales bacterium]